MGAEDTWTWPPSMDAVVAAPESHRVLFENDDVRVLEVTIAAGHREPEHTHRDPSVMIVDGPARVRYYQGGTLIFSSAPDTASAGTRASWMAPEDPHSVENVDDTGNCLAAQKHPFGIQVRLRGWQSSCRPCRRFTCVVQLIRQRRSVTGGVTALHRSAAGICRQAARRSVVLPYRRDMPA